jgi:TetR/AcrR family transcriptional repressor of nem operon
LEKFFAEVQSQMAVKGQATKTKLMDIAERLILNRGFSAMSIDEVIKEAGITKSGFFYHFDSKNSLVYALMQRYREMEAFIFSDLFKRAEELTSDPLQQMLVFVKLFAEMMADMKVLHPGCVVASITYESQQVNEQVRNITTEIVLDWRNLFREHLKKIDQVYSPNANVSSDDLADMLSTIMEGGIIISRALNDPSVLEKQLLEYRSYLELLYRPSR